jgi:uncharacterized protein (DUF2237 family)
VLQPAADRLLPQRLLRDLGRGPRHAHGLAGCAPPVVLEATHEETLAITPLGILKDYAVDA